MECAVPSSQSPDQENSSLVRRNSKNFPVKATYNFSFRSSEACFADISNIKPILKRDSPMFHIGNRSPANALEYDLSNTILSPVEASHSIRRTCSVDALNSYSRRSHRDYRNSKLCKCVDEIRQHRRLSSLCSYGDENTTYRDKLRIKKVLKSSGRSFGNSCGRCQFSPNAGKAQRPLSATPNSSSFSGRHSVIGFPIGSPLGSNGLQNLSLTLSSGSSPVGSVSQQHRQRSSIDSAIELECIPTFSYDTSFSLLDGRKCPVEFERFSAEERSSNNLSSLLWPPSPRCLGSSASGGGGRKASLSGGCSPNAFAREPPAGCERVEVIHEDRALADFSNTRIFFAPDKKVGLILKPSSNSAFCPLLPAKGINNNNNSNTNSHIDLGSNISVCTTEGTK